VKTVLFVGAGRHQRRAIGRVRELGVRVVAVDRNPDAPGLTGADVAEVIDFADVAGVTEVGRRHSVDGVLTVSADRAVPVVAAVAEDLGLPGIGRETAHLMTHKIAMRRRLAEAGVAQPEFAAIRTLQEARTAVDTVGLPAVLKPANTGGQRGLFLLQYPDELETHLHAALAESPTQEAIVASPGSVSAVQATEARERTIDSTSHCARRCSRTECTARRLLESRSSLGCAAGRSMSVGQA